ncbi:DEAD/DEAH box helicase family protein [Campylobacter corcagiensis]|uniref:DEAD/DEAH box helicase family protein n=1 Tax=Campylobacter corcagiensis TaxID=1448857 RepID=A0A7M1LFC3_9BACT|nr:DEAD/DEAH box helicase family protein [Campylobacter corcagiensis]QKF64807.1 type III restriction/modification system, restriction subunit [Campylobacter corcagiensis]QOQ87031.1 DEAD/DEAH box helicase family protein [Campylobacter corcagiensis]
MIFEKQEHQTKCIENIIEILNDFDFSTHSNLKDCLKEFYSKNKALNLGISGNKNLDILMETGTGKTFTYINAIYEIHKIYNQNKFIIFVPRKAILESVKQNLKLTKDYFYSIYKTHLKIYEYKDEKSISNIINHYINDTKELSVLLLTSSAINKKDNHLNRPKESLFFKGSVLDAISKIKPISFIDEPHLLKGEKFKEYFSKIDSLYLRFGATFPDGDDKLSNLIFALDSISAFKNYLVKQISVHTIIDENFKPLLKDLNQKRKSATFEIFLDSIPKQVDLKIGDDLGLKLNDESLKGVEINSIKSNKLYLSSGEILEKSNSYILSKEQISILLEKAIDLHFEKEERLFMQDIKALSLFFIPNISNFRGEKPFIKDEFTKLYKEKRKEVLKNPNLNQAYRKYLENDFDKNGNLQVLNGYFSGDSKSSGNVEDKEANDIRLILEEKEKLLSFKTPLRFIFSVWALQEGWDNPNVFTLTKLASSSSDTSKRQQVGRGLRLAVNQSGKRITQNLATHNFYDINALDVVINSVEGRFIADLQNEIDEASFSFNEENLNLDHLTMLNSRQKIKLFSYLEEELNAVEFDEANDNYKIITPIFEICKDDEYVKDLLKDSFDEFINFITPSQNSAAQIIDKNKKSDFTNIKKDLAKEFKELWKSINTKAVIRYNGIDDDLLINEVATKFDELKIEPKTVKITKETFISQTNSIEKEEILAQSYELGDFYILKNLMDFSINNAYPFNFIMKIYNQISNKINFKNDTKTALKSLDAIIKDSVHKGIIKKISYDFNQTCITTQTPFSYLYNADESPKDRISTSKLGKFKSPNRPKDHYLYDKVIYDSEIEKDVIEKEVVKFNKNFIKVFAKLPKFSIPTPYKEYEPDFAYLIENDSGKKIFFICETKGYDFYDKVSKDERQKIDYAKVFFKALDKYIKTKGVNADIRFETRINKQSLIDILGDLK